MLFQDFIGQSFWQSYFSVLLKERRLAPAYLFSGPRHIGKRTFLKMLCRAMLCHHLITDGSCGQCVSCRSWLGDEHPDLLRLKLGSEASSIGVEEVRYFVASVARTPLVAKSCLAIVEDLDSMTRGGFDVLLKTLEEPPASVVIFLVAESAESLPATVRSRLQHCAFAPVERSVLTKRLQEKGLTHSKSYELAMLSCGRPGLAWHWHLNPADLKTYEVAGQEFLDLLNGSLAARFAFAEQIAESDSLLQRDWRGLLAHWRLLMRDLLLLSSGETALVSHAFLRPRLDEVAKTVLTRDWFTKYQTLEWLEWALRRNANKRLALNNFFITL